MTFRLAGSAALVAAMLASPAAFAADLHETHVEVRLPGSKGLPPAYRMIAKADRQAQVAQGAPAGKIAVPVAADAAQPATALADND